MKLTLQEVQEIENVLVRGGQRGWVVVPDGDGYNVETLTPSWWVPATLHYWLGYGLYGHADAYRDGIVVFEVPYSADLERQVKTWAQWSLG